MARRRALLLAALILTACVDETPVAPGSIANARFSTAGTAAQISAGPNSLCVLAEGGASINCHGTSAQAIGTILPGAGTFLMVANGGEHACALRSDGAVQCWGSNASGQAPALKTAASGTFTNVGVGYSHSCAVRSGGVVECWGNNGDGQAPATRTAAEGSYVQVDGTNQGSCALLAGGLKVECWGSGLGVAQRTAPEGMSYSEISTNGIHGCALRSDGAADCWGHYGDLRTGPFVHVIAGGLFGCGLQADGTLNCWGANYRGEAPASRTAISGQYVQATAGSAFSCGLRDDGYYECYGQANIGSTAPEMIPVVDWPDAVVISQTRIRISWQDLAANEKRTTLERSLADENDEPVAWSHLAYVAANRTYYLDNTVTAGNRYLYRMRVCNDAGCSGWEVSDPMSVPTAAPTAFASITATAGFSIVPYINVGWSGGGDNAASILIQRRTYAGGSYGAWTLLATYWGGARSYGDYAVTSGTRYQYRVRACNILGCSPYSTTTGIVAVYPAPPATPATITVTPGAGPLVNVAWANVANETGFELQRRTHNGTAWGSYDVTYATAANAIAYQDIAVAPFTRYIYRVRACNTGGCSAWLLSTVVRTP